MALEMKVPGEIRGYEAKVVAGLSWRQLLCVIAGVPLLAVVSVVLWHHAPGLITYVDVLVFLPFAIWGWWRPKGLKPEQYAPYIFDKHFAGKVLRYDVNHAQKAQARARAERSAGRSDERAAFILEHGRAPEEG